MDNQKLKDALELFGENLVKELVSNLIKADKKATGNLIKSIDYRLVETADGVILELLAADYLQAVDKGRRKGAKQPPTKSLDRWVIARGIAPRDKNGKFISRESLKFLIARSISKNGIKPTNVIRKSIDKIYSNKTELLKKAAAEDIEKMIDDIIFKGKKIE